MQKFKPSAQSAEPDSEGRVALKYISRCVDQLAAADREDALPSWVVRRIVQAASLMGTAVSYAHRKKVK